jgi:hypothetical protein
MQSFGTDLRIVILSGVARTNVPDARRSNQRCFAIRSALVRRTERNLLRQILQPLT